MVGPIRLAVMPVLTDAVIRAEQEAQRVIDAFAKELADAQGDAHQVAPYPSPTRDTRKDYHTKYARYHVLRSISRPVQSGHKRYGRELREMCDTDCRTYVKLAKDQAAVQYLDFVEKLIAKVGECVAAELWGNHVWGASTLLVTKPDGTTEYWRTSQIVNVSKLGKLFNQWPTRKEKQPQK